MIKSCEILLSPDNRAVAPVSGCTFKSPKRVEVCAQSRTLSVDCKDLETGEPISYIYPLESLARIKITYTES